MFPVTPEVLCLATAIFFEARDQPLRGQEMIAEVIINRTESNRFPDDICSVVFQPSVSLMTVILTILENTQPRKIKRLM